MFILFLKFSDNKKLAGEYMAAHKNWIQKGIDQNIFFLVGSLQGGLGGAVLAKHSSYSELEKVVKEDPFVEKNIVKYEIYEVTPSIVHEELKAFGFS